MEKEYILQYASDLHLELREINNIPILQPIKKRNIYLALCGDIGNPFIPTYKRFLDIHTKLFVHILIVSGNHEYYTSYDDQRTIKQGDDEITRIVAEYDNVTYLNMDRIIIGRTKFIGCTLWSDVSTSTTIAERVMNDYKKIFVDNPETAGRFLNIMNVYRRNKTNIKANRSRLKANNVSTIHTRMRKWIQLQLDKFNPNDTNKKYDHIIILTHHAPSFQMLNHNKSDIYDDCYATNCENMMGSPVTHWISGHTHTSKEVDIGGTICLSNCMGYPDQTDTQFDPTRYITFK